MLASDPAHSRQNRSLSSENTWLQRWFGPYFCPWTKLKTKQTNETKTRISVCAGTNYRHLLLASPGKPPVGIQKLSVESLVRTWHRQRAPLFADSRAPWSQTLDNEASLLHGYSHTSQYQVKFGVSSEIWFFCGLFWYIWAKKKKKKWGKVMLGLNRIPSLRAAQIQRCGSPAGARLSPRSSSCQNAGASSRIYCACLLLLLLVTPRVDSSWWWVCIHHTYWPTCYTDLFTTSSSLLR